MKGSRNFVVWMLLVALLCGALPASACSLLSARTPGMPPCCRHMVPGCSMGTLVTSKPSRQSGPIASCCQMNRDDTAIAVPRSSFLPEHAQTPPLLHRFLQWVRGERAGRAYRIFSVDRCPEEGLEWRFHWGKRP